MTRVTDAVKSVEDPVSQKSGILSRMKRRVHRPQQRSYRRLAGIRFSFLIKQLQEDDPERWSLQAIADVIGVERTIVSKWHPDNVRQRREPDDRSGLTDLVIQGIHDGFGVSSEYLFMASSGLPKHVVLRDGTKRPAEADEVDHKLFRFEEEKLKIQLKSQAQQHAAQAAEMSEMRAEMAELRAMLRELVGRPAKSVR